jgi:hypothetical protein
MGTELRALVSQMQSPCCRGRGEGVLKVLHISPPPSLPHPGGGEKGRIPHQAT